MRYVVMLCLALVLVGGCTSQYATEPPLETEVNSKGQAIKTKPLVPAQTESESTGEEAKEAPGEPSGYGPGAYRLEDDSESTHPQGTQNDPQSQGVDGLNYNYEGE